MDFFFNKFTDAGLRRLYKFVLKRTIGSYLQSELLIEQLEVSSREGLVTLSDLNFNCGLINDMYLSTAPFNIVSFGIDTLTATISYNAVLNDGCTFTAGGVTVTLEPKNPTTTGTSSGPGLLTAKSDESVGNIDAVIKDDVPISIPQPTPRLDKLQSDEGQEGLTFIANWIEVVIARLKVNVDDIRIIIRDPSSGSPKMSLRLNLSKASFYNTHPRFVDVNESSVEASMKLTHSYGDASTLRPEVSAKKKVSYQ